MERQKLLYIARTKTAKVIRPTSMTPSFSLPSSGPPGTETFPAPLASVDPELVMTSRLASGVDKPLRGRQPRRTDTRTNLPSNQVLTSDSRTNVPSKQVLTSDSRTNVPSKQVLTSDSRTNVPSKQVLTSDSRIDIPSKQVLTSDSRTNVPSKQVLTSDSGALREERSHKELGHSTNARTYVKLRATHSLDTHNQNPYIVDNHKVRSGQFPSHGLPPPEPKPRLTLDNDLTNSNHLLAMQDSQNLPRYEIGRCETNNFHVPTREDRKPHTNSLHDSVPTREDRKPHTNSLHDSVPTREDRTPHTNSLHDSVPTREDRKPHTNSLRGSVPTREDRKPHTNSLHDSVPTENNNKVPASGKSFRKNPPPVAPKPTNICAESTAASDSKQSFTSSEDDSLKYKLNSTPGLVVYQNGSVTSKGQVVYQNGSVPSKGPVVYQNGSVASKENHIEPSPAMKEIISWKPKPREDRLHSIYKTGINSPQSFQTTFSGTSTQTKSHQELNSAAEYRSSRLLPETKLPVKFQLYDNGPLPEMYITSPPLYTAAIRPRSARTAGQHVSQIYQPRNGPRQPLVAIDTSFNKPVEDHEQQSPTMLQTDQDPTNTRLSSGRSSGQHTHTSVLHKRQSTEYFPSSPQAGTVPEETSDSVLVPEFSRNSWKRNSMRLATCGYTSMSDLTASLKFLTDQQPEIVADECSQDHDELVDQMGQAEVNAEAWSQSEDVIEDCDTVLVPSEPDGPTYDSVCDRHNETGEETLDDEALRELYFQEQPVVILERNGINRLSYRMATSSITDISILCADMDVHSDHSNQAGVMARNMRNRSFGPLSPKRRSLDKKSTESDDVKGNVPKVIDSLSLQTLTNQRHDLDESTYKLKRLSFTLATASMSDLTFPYVDYNTTMPPSIPNNDKSDDPHNTIRSTGSSGGVRTPESSQQSQSTEGSCYSSGRHSSFGSVYSFRSLDTGKVKSPQEKVRSPGKRHACHPADMKDAPRPNDSHPASDSSDSDDSASGDTTFYYTASDTSFVTAEGEQVSRQHVSVPTHRLPALKQSSRPISLQDPTHTKTSSQRARTMSPQELRPGRELARDDKSHRPSARNGRPHSMPVPDGRQEVNNRYERLSLNADNLHRKTNYLMFNEPPLKQSTPVNNGNHCLGSDLDNKSTSRVPVLCDRNHVQSPPNDVQSTERCDCPCDGLAKNHSTENYLVRHTYSSPLHVPIDLLRSTDANFSRVGQAASFSSSSSFCSLSSSGEDATWEDTPRFPPSLGKPRRKLYAGFDSQPLPMDSFISDSSSVYSMQTCGSSRSAEVESSPRTVTTPPNIHAVSCIVSSTRAPARWISQEEMLDLLKYTDKIIPARENNHNIYLDDRFRDNCYDKTFSSDSLESYRSDDTIVGSEHTDTVHHSHDYPKLAVGTKPGRWDMYNNAVVDRHDKTRNERRHLDKLNNSYGVDFGSRLSNNTFVSGNVVNSKNQLKTMKGKKHSQSFCMCRQSSLDPFTLADGTVSVVLNDKGQWDISM